MKRYPVFTLPMGLGAHDDGDDESDWGPRTSVAASTPDAGGDTGGGDTGGGGGNVLQLNGQNLQLNGQDLTLGD